MVRSDRIFVRDANTRRELIKLRTGSAYRRTRILLYLGFVSGLVALGFVGVVTVRSSSEFVHASQELSQRQQVLNQTAEIRRIASRADTVFAGFLLNGDEKFLNDFRDTPSRLDKAFKQLRQLDEAKDQSEVVAEAAARQRFANLRQSLVTYRTDGASAARRIAADAFNLSTTNRLGDALGRIDERERKALTLAQGKNDRNRFVAAGVLGIGLALAVVAIFLSLGTVLRDFGRRLQAEESLNHNLALQALIFNSANVAFIATDLQGRITMFNRAAERWLGYKENEVFGQSDIKLFHDPEEIARARRELAASLGETIPDDVHLHSILPLRGKRYDHEWNLIRKDGSTLPVFASVSALRARSGQIVGFVSVGTNLSLEKEARTELDRYVRQLETANALAEERNAQLRLTAAALEESRDEALAATRLKSEFLANMSHEIRTPMNGVMGTAHLLEATNLDARQSGYVGTILRSAKSLLTILNDILDLSKMEAGKMPLEASPFSLRTTLENVCDSFSSIAHAKQLSLSCRIEPEVADTIIGDAGRLNQIIGNLVFNAIKFTNAGSVTVTASNPTRQADRAVYRIVIEDTGIGIPRERQTNIFDTFTQGDGSLTREFGGTGLGLSICRQLVELMGGQIGVKSLVGKGSQFWIEIELPCEDGVLPVLETGAPEPENFMPREEWLRGLRVLLVEDNLVNQMVASDLMASWGCVVETADNGAEAIEMVRGTAYDLVCMDLQMPVMDGISATRRIRQSEFGSARRLPILAMTANAMNGDREQCLEAGMDGFVPKPIQPRLLLDQIRALHVHRRLTFEPRVEAHA